MQITLGRKLFFYTSLLLLAVLVVAFVFVERNQARQWRDHVTVQHLAFARFATPELLKHFRGNFSQATGPAHRQQLQGLLDFNPDLLKFSIYSPTGRLLFDRPTDRSDASLLPPLNLTAAVNSIDLLAQTLELSGGNSVLEVVAPAFGPTGQPVVYIRYLFSFDSVAQRLLEMRQTFLLIACFSGLFALLLVALVARSFTRPIQRLMTAVRAISSGQLETRIATGGSDELAQLGVAFNEMATSLSANQSELKAKNQQLQHVNSDLQQMQERMLRTECLAAVGQVAAGVSHEIDNPVGIILGYAELLLAECSGDDPRREDLLAIIEECHRCRKITGGLLGLARTGEPHREPVDLPQLLTETVDSLRLQKIFRSLAIHLPAQQPVVEVWADRDRIRQVLMNLLLNAAQALQGQGNIWLEMRATNSQLIIEVHDDGPGFAEDHLDKIFEPFFTTKTGSEGTGLGLSICRKLVEEHGGDISAAQSTRGGALLIVALPLRQRDVEYPGLGGKRL
jgi:signal transduction histidine kinase